MTYYLRVEGVNLGNFILDTNDLATIRGGSLLLLEAMDHVEDLIEKEIPSDPKAQEKQLLDELNYIKHDNSLKTAEKKKKKLEIKNKRKNLKQGGGNPRITKGASWGLFQLETNKGKAVKIKNNILKSFNDDEKYKYATFMVDLYLETEQDTYQLNRDKVQTVNHWQQLQSPALSITKEGTSICTLDQVRPSSKKRHLPDEDKVYISDSVWLRREYGRNQKKHADFYKKTTKLTDIDNLELTKDLGELSQNKEAKNLNNKIAFIYIDGNSFGKKQKESKSESEQRAFDTQTRKGRETVLANIITQIKDKKGWLNTTDKLRLETLLWGGDEIIWVVPAWQGWWMLNQFYIQAKEHINLERRGANGQVIKPEPLYHGSSIIFCHHNAPIHRIDSLARSLADGFSKKKPYKQKNMIAYQILESFDHIGTSLKDHREERAGRLTDNIDRLLINADDMVAIEDCIRQLKNHNFPRRKIYQIVQAYRDEQDPNNKQAKKLYDKLTGGNKTNESPSQEQQSYKQQLEKLQEIFSENEDEQKNAHWLHLMELWDYVGLEDDKQTREEK